MTWTRNQQIALAVVPKCSAFMSFFGSCWIVSEVLFDEQKKVGKIANVYSRLLLGMSFFEALESIWNFQSTWPIPVGTDGVYGAIGNTQYCVAQGFFLQLGLAVPMYNASLSIYYLLVIKYNLSDSQLQRRVEPYMHATAISIPFSTAMACVALNLFNNANLWCWIAPYPLDCADTARFGTDGNCIRGDNAWIYRWSFYFAPLWSCIITAIVTMMVVYKTVRFTDVRSLKYRKPQVTFGASTTIQQQNPPPPELPSSTTRRESNLFVEPVQEEEFPQVYIEMDAPLEGGSQVRDSVMDAEEPEDDEDCSKSVDDRTFKFRSASFSLGRSSHLSIDSPTPSENNGTRASSRTAGCSSKSSLSIQSLSSRVKHWNKVRAQDMQDHHRSHDVFVQALWYTAAFLVTHLFSTVNRSLQLSIGHTFFPLLVMHSFFDPFQGFLNFLVYRRPRYIRYRRRNMSRFRAIHLALQWTGTASTSFRASDRGGGGGGGMSRQSRMSAVSFASSVDCSSRMFVAPDDDDDDEVSLSKQSRPPNGIIAKESDDVEDHESLGEGGGGAAAADDDATTPEPVLR